MQTAEGRREKGTKEMVTEAGFPCCREDCFFFWQSRESTSLGSAGIRSLQMAPKGRSKLKEPMPRTWCAPPRLEAELQCEDVAARIDNNRKNLIKMFLGRKNTLHGTLLTVI